MSTLNVTNIKAADGTTGLTIANSTGLVTMPNSSGFVSDFVAWSVKRTSNQSISNGTQTQVQWDSEIFDTQTHLLVTHLLFPLDKVDTIMWGSSLTGKELGLHKLFNIFVLIVAQLQLLWNKKLETKWVKVEVNLFK